MSLSALRAERPEPLFGYARFYAELDEPVPPEFRKEAPASDTFHGWVVSGWRKNPREHAARYLNQAAYDLSCSRRQDIAANPESSAVYRDLARKQTAIAREIRLRAVAERLVAA